MGKVELIDTHTHLGAEDFATDRAEVVARARAAGITRLITIGAGYGLRSAPDAIRLSETFEGVYAAIGVHPNDAAVPFDDKFLPPLASHPKVVAIGETGLDFYRDNASPTDQERWFIHQINLAREVKKPLIIHSRNAGIQCLSVLKAHGASEVGGVFHCYAEDVAFAIALAELHFLISIPGSITFKKADQLRATVREIPLTQIMLETDAPFLAPEPFRGKRCESSQMIETAKMLASVKGISLEELAEITTKTAEQFFNLPARERK